MCACEFLLFFASSFLAATQLPVKGLLFLNGQSLPIHLQSVYLTTLTAENAGVSRGTVGCSIDAFSKLFTSSHFEIDKPGGGQLSLNVTFPSCEKSFQSFACLHFGAGRRRRRHRPDLSRQNQTRVPNSAKSNGPANSTTTASSISVENANCQFVIHPSTLYPSTGFFR